MASYIGFPLDKNMALPLPKSFIDSASRRIGEAFLQKAPKADRSEFTTRYGYPVVDATKAGYGDFFKQNPHVAGMAVGKGSNGDDTPYRYIVVNPFNDAMLDKTKREALFRIEAARHFMDEQKDKPRFKVTPEMQQWREAKFKKGRDPYATDDEAFNESIISRIIVGDDVPAKLPKEMLDYAAQINAALDKR